MNQQPYSAGVDLLDQFGNLSAVLDVRAHQGMVHLTLNVIGARASGNLTLDLLDEDEIDDLLHKLDTAKRHAWPQLHSSGAPA